MIAKFEYFLMYRGVLTLNWTLTPAWFWEKGLFEKNYRNFSYFVEISKYLLIELPNFIILISDHILVIGYGKFFMSRYVQKFIQVCLLYDDKINLPNLGQKPNTNFLWQLYCIPIIFMAYLVVRFFLSSDRSEKEFIFH